MLDRQIACDLEQDAWIKLVKYLEAMGAITEEDARAPIGAYLISTRGLHLLYLIKQWGFQYADLVTARMTLSLPGKEAGE